ncbi:protein of unknown function [Streptomyces sp. TLI_053]|uniref:DUF397 domain-containing protein n=1 Tax=Streptomyces sp. TLI_053 TaxID=1855352 RepID=UPI00087D486A|nr:DUF397 domain-containing protein [Streptomyces sp. TLI_053]SDT69928.1 protein of unknown function [Streptomyces sp. TLI_053]
MERIESLANEFEFATAFCRDPKIGNCPQVAINVAGTVAVRDSARPDQVATFTVEDWRGLVAQQAESMGLLA